MSTLILGLGPLSFRQLLGGEADENDIGLLTDLILQEHGEVEVYTERSRRRRGEDLKQPLVENLEDWARRQGFLLSDVGQLRSQLSQVGALESDQVEHIIRHLQLEARVYGQIMIPPGWQKLFRKRYIERPRVVVGPRIRPEPEPEEERIVLRPVLTYMKYHPSTLLWRPVRESLHTGRGGWVRRGKSRRYAVAVFGSAKPDRTTLIEYMNRHPHSVLSRRVEMYLGAHRRIARKMVR